LNSIRSKIGLQFIVSNGSIAAHFALTVVLARLMSPSEVGIFSIAAVFVGFTHVFRDFGVVSFIKRQKVLTPQTQRAAMGVLLTSSWAIAFLLYLLSGVLANFFQQPGIREIMPVLALGFVFIPFGAIPLAVLSRDFQVQRTATVTAVATVTYITTCITLASLKFSYMSMAWANLASIVVCGILATVLMPRHLLLLPSFKGWKNVVQFGAGAILTSSIKALDTALPDIILGKLSGPHLVGIYSRANSTVNILNTVTTPTIDYFALPYLAKVHHAGEKLSTKLVPTIALLTGIVWPALAFTTVIASDLITFLYGTVWSESAPVVPWLCLVVGVQVTFATFQPALTAMGRPYLSALPLLAVVGTKVLLALSLYDGSLVSFARAVALAECLGIPAYLILGRWRLAMGATEWLHSLNKSAATALAVLGSALLFYHLVGDLGSPFSRLCAVTVLFMVVWLLLLRLFHHPLWPEINKGVEMVKGILVRRDVASEKAVPPEEQVVLYGAVAAPPSALGLTTQWRSDLKLAIKATRDTLRWRRGSLTKLDYRDYITPSTYNKGDEAIVLASHDALLAGQSRREAVRSNWGDRRHFVDAPTGTHKRVIVVCGSGYIAFERDGSLARRVVADLEALEKIATPVVLYGIGINRHLETGLTDQPFQSAADEDVVRRLLLRCAHISVRDQESQRILALYTDKPVRLVGDPAFLYAEVGRSLSHAASAQRASRPLVGVNFPFHFLEVAQRIQQDLPAYVEMLKQIQQATHCGFRYMVHFDTEHVVAKMIAAAGVELEVISGGPDELCAGYAGMNVHLGGMLHSCILAASTGTPCVALAYDTKHAGFFNLIDLPHYCIPSSPFDKESFVSAVLNALSHEQQIRATIHAARQRLEQQAQHFVADVNELMLARPLSRPLPALSQAGPNAVGLPRVSIIMPVHNGKDFIHEAIDSALAQSYPSFELLVIDDGSDDMDYKLLESKDIRVRVIRQQNGGVSRARNSGIAQARGEFIAFLDADDFWLPGKLEAQVRYFDAHPAIGFVFGRYLKWAARPDGLFPPAASMAPDCKDVVLTDPQRSGWAYTRMLMGMLIGMSAAIMRKSVCTQIGVFDEGMRIGEDYEYWFRTSRVTEMHSLAAVVSLYRTHGASTMARVTPTNHMVRLLSAMEQRWGTSNPDHTQLLQRDFRKRLGQVHFDHGYTHFWKGDIKIARQEFLRSFLMGNRRLHSLGYLGMASFAQMVSWIRSVCYKI
jgi:O-antigen/teichoic acid export membrane protein/glycosyltransferase involved in cell wall biosynthesis/polysaccharide pyruvyl transferase WcaK-like protein